MRFLKKSRHYIVQYNKKEAIEELKKDKRVKSIKVTPKEVVITTNPIIPESVNPLCKPLVLRPVGTYIITLTELVTMISIHIHRVEGTIHDSYHNPHITSGGSTICWGNMDSDIQYICANKDWYWAGKKCLELVDDFDDDGLEVYELIEILCLAQIQCAKDKRFTKLLGKKVKKLYRKKRWSSISDIFEEDDEEEEEDTSSTTNGWRCNCC